MGIIVKGSITFEKVILGNELQLLKQIKDKIARREPIPFEDLDFLLGLSEGSVSGTITDTVGVSSSEDFNNNISDRNSELQMRILDIRVKQDK